MGVLFEKIKAKVIGGINFANDEVEASVESLVNVVNDFSIAALAFEGKCEDLAIDPEGASKAVLGLAELIGEATDISDEAVVAKAKALVKELIENADAELEELTEELFNTALDFEVSVESLNEVIDDALPVDEGDDDEDPSDPGDPTNPGDEG